MKHPIPVAALVQHIGVLGKTGSGKTTTTKGIVEHIVRGDPAARVCVLDSIKSDWWGLTSSADGKRPGLPFQILGGPRGHVALPESAGKAIGELVGSGALPLSIIDMKDFTPGGLQRFFNDFVPSLMRRMKGVVYLVLEEAHEFAPKERSGIGAETMAIHYAKKLATAGRSMGIRLIVCTQRTQSLHNAVLGSCETLVAHRFTAPADQEPIKRWLKANMDKATYEKVANSLSSIKTGTGWIVSGETETPAELVQFPALTTFDNSATPTGDLADLDVKTAPVDREKLRGIIGAAVEEADAKDVDKLQARIRQLEIQLGGMSQATVHVADSIAEDARRNGFNDGWAKAHAQAAHDLKTALESVGGVIGNAIVDAFAPMMDTWRQQALPPAPNSVPMAAAVRPPQSLAPAGRPAPTGFPVASPGASGGLSTGARTVLTVLAQRTPSPLPAKRAAALAGFSPKKSTWRGILAELRKAELITGSDVLAITPSGLTRLGRFDPLPSGRDLLAQWCERVGKGEASVLRILATLRGECAASDLANRAGYDPSKSTWRGVLATLRGLGLIDGSRKITLQEDLR